METFLDSGYWSLHVILLHFHAADEAEQNFSEDDGWEFVTLADQVTVT